MACRSRARNFKSTNGFQAQDAHLNVRADQALRSRTTALLQLADSGDLPPLEELVPLVYGELREMARWQLAGEHRNVTLQTTALVHEAFLRLVDDEGVTQRGRAYFFGAAARAMRHVLVDAARRRNAAKRGAGAPLADVPWEGGRVDAFASELLDLNRALDDLGHRNPRHVRVAALGRPTPRPS